LFLLEELERKGRKTNCSEVLMSTRKSSWLLKKVGDSIISLSINVKHFP